MAKPMPMPMADDEMAEGEASDPLAEVEASAWTDIKAAIKSGDDAAGVAALRDFVTACIKREMSGEYTEQE